MDHHYKTEAKEGLKHSGDGVIIFENDGYHRFVVIDSLGHGERAEKVVDKVNTLRDEIRHKSPARALRFLHRELRGTRGAAVSIADVSEERFLWSAVGNVEIKTSDDEINPINMSGIVGYRLRKTQEREFDIEPGTVFIIHTDGISSRFSMEEDIPLKKDAEYIAEFMMDNYRKEKDDSTVVVIKT